MIRSRRVELLLAVGIIGAACASGPITADPGTSIAADTTVSTRAGIETTTVPAPTTAPRAAVATTEPTEPRELVDPARPFSSRIDPFDGDALARSTWEPGCPVEPDDLRLLTLAHHRPDGTVGTGEMVVHADWAADIVGVFAELYVAGFPIEEMRIITPADVAAPPPDDNVTTAFVCRAVTGGTSFSQHAYGLAIDINPLWNPYLRGSVLIPPDAAPWLDRDDVRPGMIVEGDVVVSAFDAIGWGWGGRWRSLLDWQHFSANGR